MATGDVREAGGRYYSVEVVGLHEGGATLWTPMSPSRTWPSARAPVRWAGPSAGAERGGADGGAPVGWVGPSVGARVSGLRTSAGAPVGWAGASVGRRGGRGRALGDTPMGEW
jgi:hypothetical protein